MFAVSFRLFSHKMFAAASAVVAVISAGIIISSVLGAGAEKTSAFCSDPLSVTEYLGSFGLEIDAGNVVADEITVPEQFNDVYENYNKIQKSQGFDLNNYRGCRLTRYTFSVINYPDPDQNVFAEVLLYEDTVVAANIYSTSLDGFLKALK